MSAYRFKHAFTAWQVDISGGDIPAIVVRALFSGELEIGYNKLIIKSGLNTVVAEVEDGDWIAYLPTQGWVKVSKQNFAIYIEALPEATQERK